MYQLHHGDCVDFMRGMADNSVTMTLTDIPYGEVNRDSSGLRNLDKADADVLTFDLRNFVREVARITSGSAYIFCGWEQYSTILDEMRSLGMSTRAGVWEKTNPSPMNGDKLWMSGVELCAFGRWPKATFTEMCQNPVWRYKVETETHGHPTQKPVKLMGKLIRASSNCGDTVFDPCAGSGSTMLAAIENGRKAIGCELNEDYCAIIERRLSSAQTPLF